MKIPRHFNRNRPWWRTLQQVVTISLIAALLAGLIPPPLVTSVADLIGYQPLTTKALSGLGDETPND